MKSPLAGLAAMMLTALTGCSQGTPGGAGTTGVNPAYGQADDTFNLSMPALGLVLQQGMQTEGIVGIKRAKNFGQDVTLKFTGIPSDVTVEPASPVIKSGETDAKIKFDVGDDAPLGDFKVKVTGSPTNGRDAQIEFKLIIARKDGFTLTVPHMSTLKQGGTHTVSIGITRDKAFKQRVSLEFGAMPLGVSLDPHSLVVSHGDAEARVTLTGARDASLGYFTIKVTGHPDKGADASNEFKLAVIK